jgi:hypothetical protein
VVAATPVQFGSADASSDPIGQKFIGRDRLLRQPTKQHRGVNDNNNQQQQQRPSIISTSRLQSSFDNRQPVLKIMDEITCTCAISVLLRNI